MAINTDDDLKMFMEKLRRLVYENYYTTWVGYNPFIQARKPEIQLLYEELGCLIQSCCFKDDMMIIAEEQLVEDDDDDDVGKWKRRLIKAAQEAEDTIDMFVSSAIIKKGTYRQMTAPIFIDNILIDCSLKNLKGVMGDLKSIREEMEMNSKKGNNFHKQDMMVMDNKFESNGNTRVNLSETEHEELIVGFDDNALLIIDRLTGYRKRLDIISIVGMGGLGKTTLATKIFNDSLVQYLFDMRGWITVSQAYSKRDLLLQLLASIGKSVPEAVTESKLCEMVYQSLKRIKYLIVIDDIWSCKAWDDVGHCFPDDNTGSRVLVTTRLSEVALYASQGGFTLNLGHLSKDQSWELLSRKTFRGYECPESLIETGKHIAKRCGGLPLALVVIAGLLEKGEKSKDLWEKIAERVGSYIINDPEGCLDTLALSYDHLPSHLRKCFLYVGGFPENYKIQVQRLIRLWMAEGFIKKAGQRSLEEEGEDYLMDLIDRNLLIVADKRSNGDFKSCRLHDLLRELCLKKADEENFFKKTSMSMSHSSPLSYSASSMVKQRRLFTDYEDLCKIYSNESATYTRSVLCFDDSIMLKCGTSWVSSFLLLRVLDLLNVQMFDLSSIRILVHLRYLAVWSCSRDILFSQANLCTLQTLIVKGKFQSFTYSPNNMVNLRHLQCDRINFSTDFNVHRLFNLQTISRLRVDHRTLCLLESFPNIKKLGCSIASTSSNLSFAFLSSLEALNIDQIYDPLTLVNPIRFPETLKKLTLKGLCLPWNYMSMIQQLPKLEVLKLLEYSFIGHQWEVGDEQFHRLKFLKLENLNIHFWEASSINFPCLRKLVVRNCKDLQGIPLGLGNIYTLEHIQVDSSNSSVLESVNEIQEEQRKMGSCDIHVNISHMNPGEVFFEKLGLNLSYYKCFELLQ